MLALVIIPQKANSNPSTKVALLGHVLLMKCILFVNYWIRIILTDSTVIASSANTSSCPRSTTLHVNECLKCTETNRDTLHCLSFLNKPPSRLLHLLLAHQSALNSSRAGLHTSLLEKWDPLRAICQMMLSSHGPSGGPLTAFNRVCEQKAVCCLCQWRAR